jgi:hypothetical protein
VSWSVIPSTSAPLSGEHGDGQARGELLDRMFGPELVEAFREFKAIWDPDGRMNPGTVVDPYRSTPTCGSIPATARGPSARSFASRATAAASRRRPSAASASGPAATRAGRCARATR